MKIIMTQIHTEIYVRAHKLINNCSQPMIDWPLLPPYARLTLMNYSCFDLFRKRVVRIIFSETIR